MTVRAKFTCQEIRHMFTQSPDAVCAEIRLTAVYGEGNENASWSKWTPSGEIKMTITNPAAIDKFELGRSYFVDFIPVAN